MNDPEPNETAAAEVLLDQPLDQPQPEFQPVVIEHNPTHTALVKAVCDRTAEILGPAKVAPDFIEKFGPALAEAVDQQLEKFARGQLKHGGDIRERDLLYELTQEAQDTLNYLLTMRIVRMTIPVPIE